MNITDSDGKWRLADGGITKLETGEFVALKRMPSGNTIAHMNYNLFMQKCATAFATGEWPKTHWASGRITD